MTTSADAQVRQYSHINGSSQDLLDRLAVSELCKGWPVYRDASEWKNYRSLFCKDAMVWTTWSKGQTIDNFIAISKRGKDRGDFIMHRECGTLVEVSQTHPDRAIGKMKATITQRFRTQASQAHDVLCAAGAEFDVDCDCRFIFFCVKQQKQQKQKKEDSEDSEENENEEKEEAGCYEWKAKYVKLFYEKDKVVPVDGHRAPTFPPALLARFPEGYRHLAAAQSALGYPVTRCLPTARDHGAWHAMYGKMEQWLAGSDVDLLCEDDDDDDDDNKTTTTSYPKTNGRKRKVGDEGYDDGKEEKEEDEEEAGLLDGRGHDATRVKTTTTANGGGGANGTCHSNGGGGHGISLKCGLDYEKNGLNKEISFESVR